MFEPLGFGTWEATGSLITGFIAKELVVSTLSQIYIGAQDDLDIETTTSFAQNVLEIMVGFWEAAVDACDVLFRAALPLALHQGRVTASHDSSEQDFMQKLSAQLDAGWREALPGK